MVWSTRVTHACVLLCLPQQQMVGFLAFNGLTVTFILLTGDKAEAVIDVECRGLACVTSPR